MKCEIIRDLLPLYCDGLCSEASKQEIEAHVAQCEGVPHLFGGNEGGCSCPLALP